MCDKEPYSNYQSAMTAIKGLIRRGIKKLKSYKCKDCNLYHLSSVHPNTKPIGYRGKKRKVVAKPKKKKVFNKIKVTKEEIEKGKQHKTQNPGLFYKLKNKIP